MALHWHLGVTFFGLPGVFCYRLLTVVGNFVIVLQALPCINSSMFSHLFSSCIRRFNLYLSVSRLFHICFVI